MVKKYVYTRELLARFSHQGPISGEVDGEVDM